MNCKPGDLAVITYVRDPLLEANVGQIVEVLRADRWHPSLGQIWWVKMHGIGVTRHHGVRVSPEGLCGDIALRPINGLPVDEEQRDEVVA